MRRWGAGSTTATPDLAGLTSRWTNAEPVPLPLPVPPLRRPPGAPPAPPLPLAPLPRPPGAPPIRSAVAAEEAARQPKWGREPAGRGNSCGDERGRGRSLRRFRSGSFENSTREHSGSLKRFRCRRGAVAAVAAVARGGDRSKGCALAAVGGDRSHGFVEDRGEKREKTVDCTARPKLGGSAMKDDPMPAPAFSCSALPYPPSPRLRRRSEPPPSPRLRPWQPATLRSPAAGSAARGSGAP